MLRLSIALVLGMLAGPAHALSCMAPDVVRLYTTIRKDDADYLVVKGKVTLTEPPNFAEPMGMKRSEALTSGRASGLALSSSGFDVSFDRPITVRATCLASWCGDPGGLDTDLHLFALRIEGDDLILERGPCDGFVERWSKEQEQRLLDCHLNGECELKQF